MKIDLIIPSFERGRSLALTLLSVRRMSPRPEKIWVLDQSKSIDPEILSICGGSGEFICLFCFSIPGAQYARNWAAKESSADILLFLDDDVDPEPRLVEAHLENYRDPTIHAVAGFYLEPGESETSQPKDGIWWRPLTQLERYPASYSKRVDSPLWPSCNGSIRREVLQKAGYRCVHDPKARLFHRKEPTGGNRPVKPGDRVIANREKWYTWFYFFWMNYGLLGLGEILLRMRTNVFRRPYLMNPKLLLIAVAEMGAGLAMAVGVMFKGRKLMGKG
ncbi:MAG: glycosyltransferase family 2 protein [Bacteroidetes bacterium]|nr:glycosyltransferase family 2 protein [Bacteroidota bacterium]